MTDKNDIHFDEKGEENSCKVSGGPDSPDSHGAEPDNSAMSSSRRPRTFLSRSLLLILFLLLLCLAAGYYFLGNSLPPIAEKQPIAQPVTPRGPTREPAPATLETIPAERPEEKGAAEKPVGQVRTTAELTPVAPSPETDFAEPPPGEGDAGKPAGQMPAAADEVHVAPPPGPAAAELSAPPPRAYVPDKYVLQGGPFLVPENLVRAEKTVRSLGFEPRLEKGEKTVKMTRLRVGRYPLEKARAKVRELKAMAPDVFLLPKGDRAAVYAGSFSDTHRARRLAAQLYQQGVRVEEEPVKITLPVTILTFGGYADMATARQAAERARANGLEVLIVRRP